MKKFALVLSTFLAAGSLAFAQDSATKPATKSPAVKQVKSTQAVKPSVVGEVASVDLQKNTVTFKNEKGESLTWPASGKALVSLKTLKAGDKVTIHYAVDAKGAPTSATSIKPVAAPVAKAAPAPKTTAVAKVETPQAAPQSAQK